MHAWLSTWRAPTRPGLATALPAPAGPEPPGRPLGSRAEPKMEPEENARVLLGRCPPAPQFSVPPPRLVSGRFSSDSIQIISCFSNTHQLGDGRAFLVAQL